MKLGNSIKDAFMFHQISSKVSKEITGATSNTAKVPICQM